LFKWKLPDGNIGEGILYKPENFDSLRKYPVILNFYENQADEVNNFLFPKLSSGDLDIPYFVSNGYLVLCPNIYFKVGHTGECALNSVLSAAKNLSRKSWVDSRKMGIHGHSMGGYEVNYIVSHTNFFAAASEGSGPTDLISGYGSLNGWGISLQFIYEAYQLRLNSTLWNTPNMYIKNSPIFFADKVRTPLLIMHNKEDFQVPWQQGIEWYTALRRLRKKTWMLQYDDEGHAINSEQNQLDYSFRVMQFFDVYLKGDNPPKWMVQGIPAKLKGIELGLDKAN